MRLYPQDLGERLNGEIQKQRILNYQGGPYAIKPNFLGGWILGGMVVTILFWAIQEFAVAVMLGIATVGLFGWYAYSALRTLDACEGRQSPLTSYELHVGRQIESDPLAQQFLTLANAVVALSAAEDAMAEREVRNAISALGLAVEALPPEQKIETDNPSALRAEAAAQDAGAKMETDTIVAASLRRRSESLERRADTAERTLLLLRRNQALREEVGEQISALQTSLTALQVGGRQSTPELSSLAASIQCVAHAANAITAARAEVDTLVTEPYHIQLVSSAERATRIIQR